MLIGLTTAAGLGWSVGNARAQGFGGGFGGNANNQGAVGAAAANGLAGVPTNAQLDHGRELFTRQWTAGDPQSPGGDGLGPMFNARSCIDCHNQAGLGGAGRGDHNVDLLALTIPRLKQKADRDAFAARAGNLHPGFTTGPTFLRPTITLHKFSTNPAYADWRAEFVTFATARAPRFGSEAKVEAANRGQTDLPALFTTSLAASASKGSKAVLRERLHLQVVQRNTPALFGAGLIDSIPGDVLQQTAAAEAKQKNGIRGQVAVASDGGVGKFGWRGQTATLKQFVMGACSNELGLQVPNNVQAVDPLRPGHKAPGLDLTQEQCDELTAFVASLPAPEQILPTDARERAEVGAGAYGFNRIGCAACHVQKLGNVAGIYSDLLLHDMGPDLADPVGANPQPKPQQVVCGQYFGGAIPNDDEEITPPSPDLARKWRTPPLWGVADSAPYLHDGRARTLKDAILMHYGEATNSRLVYTTLSGLDRNNLLAFLESLAAPAAGP